MQHFNYARLATYIQHTAWAVNTLPLPSTIRVRLVYITHAVIMRITIVRTNLCDVDHVRNKSKAFQLELGNVRL